jgi:hypothetical protein
MNRIGDLSIPSTLVARAFMVTCSFPLDRKTVPQQNEAPASLHGTVRMRIGYF